VQSAIWATLQSNIYGAFSLLQSCDSQRINFFLLLDLFRCKLTCMMVTGKILVQLRLFIMQIWGSPKSQCPILGSSCSRYYSWMLQLFSCSHLDLNYDMFTWFCTFYYSFYDRSSPIYTQPRYLPPSKMLDADVTDSVIGEGCVIKVSYLWIMFATCWEVVVDSDVHCLKPLSLCLFNVQKICIFYCGKSGSDHII
jgi:hypothetical protein